MKVMASFQERDDVVDAVADFEMFKGLTDSKVVAIAERRCVCGYILSLGGGMFRRREGE